MFVYINGWDVTIRKFDRITVLQVENENQEVIEGLQENLIVTHIWENLDLIAATDKSFKTVYVRPEDVVEVDPIQR